MFGGAVGEGALFYGTTRHRHTVSVRPGVLHRLAAAEEDAVAPPHVVILHRQQRRPAAGAEAEAVQGVELARVGQQVAQAHVGGEKVAGQRPRRAGLSGNTE